MEYERVEKGILNTKDLVTGVVTSLLFGIHPLHVESVAWVSERKDVLCAFFYLLSLHAYIRYVDTRRSIFYGITLASFVMALMSKPMAVSLPLVLLIFDIYPLNRMTRDGFKWPLTEKLPMYILGLLASLTTIWAQLSGGALKIDGEIPFTDRILVAVRSIILYLYKMIIPFNLSPFYPYPEKVELFKFEFTVPLLLFFLITSLSIVSFKKNKLFSAIWFYYIVTLIPVIGIVKVGSLASADRYTYLPSLGPFLLAGLWVGVAFERYSKIYLLAVITSLTLFFSVLTHKTINQINIWKDSITLWSHAVRLYPFTSELTYYNLGNAYLISGSYRNAIENYNVTIKINPHNTDAYVNRGNAYVGLGEYNRAISDYTRAIELDPQIINAYLNRGGTFGKIGDYKQAIRDYEMAIKIDPKCIEAYYSRGNIYYDLRDAQNAITDFNMVIEINPRHVGAYVSRGNIYGILSYHQDAIRDYNKAIEIDPQNVTAIYNRGVAYFKLRNFQEALSDFKRTVELNPQDEKAYGYLEQTYSELRKTTGH